MIVLEGYPPVWHGIHCGWGREFPPSARPSDGKEEPWSEDPLWLAFLAGFDDGYAAGYEACDGGTSEEEPKAAWRRRLAEGPPWNR